MSAVSGSSRAKDVLTVSAVAVVLALLVFPFLWIVVTSLRPADQLLQAELQLFPEGITFDAFGELWSSGFVRYLINSLGVCVLAAAISVAIALLAAYSLSRRRFRGPGYLDSIPTELDDAAKIDGCSTLRTIITVIFPVVRPGVVITATYAFVVAWEEYLFAAALMTDREIWTAPVGLAAFLGEFSSRWDLVMAASVLTTLPTLAVFLLLQRGLVSGLVAGVGK